MKQEYSFFGGGTLEFDDTKSVRELIECAFDTFGYEEPMGMEIVTLFQGHHPDTGTGWFTTDVSLCCADEIRTPDELFFAYHLPGVFYFAEGGWGHHMPELGNRPPIPNEVSLTLRFDGSRHTIVINGTYTFMDIVRVLKQNGYVQPDCDAVRVIPVGTMKSYAVPLSDPIMSISLTELVEHIELYHNRYLKLDNGYFPLFTIFALD